MSAVCHIQNVIMKMPDLKVSRNTVTGQEGAGERQRKRCDLHGRHPDHNCVELSKECGHYIIGLVCQFLFGLGSFQASLLVKKGEL